MDTQYIKPTHEVREMLKKHGFSYEGTYAEGGDTFRRIKVGGIQGLRTYTEQIVCINGNGLVSILHQPAYPYRGEKALLHRVFDAPVLADANILALLDNA